MTHSNNPEHDSIVELLPWYVKGTLNPVEHSRVDKHLASCPECQQESMLYRQLDSEGLTSDRTPSWQPTPAHFSSILQSIDALESKADSAVSRAKTPKHGLKQLSKLSAWLKATPNPIFWFMSLETVALTALVLLTVARFPQQPGEQAYQTLSNERPSYSANLPRLSIVFAEDITEREIRTLMQAQHGQLVQGPSMLGVYTIELALEVANESQQAIDNLRANPKVKLVESIASTNQQ